MITSASQTMLAAVELWKNRRTTTGPKKVTTRLIAQIDKRRPRLLRTAESIRSRYEPSWFSGMAEA
ncbi:MAG: hypothetical protein M3Y49_01980 [Actinomycetota bacterium]|nr:hypothetical protein [Actinomycetota bacterium]